VGGGGTQGGTVMHSHRVFLDSSFWIAFRDVRQTHHARARDCVAALFRQRTQFLSTPFVFAETHATFARSQGVRERIIGDFWENPLLHFAEVTDADHRAAIRLLRQHEDKSFPFCDAISFVVMRRLGVRRVAAFDEHFRQIGGFEMVG
jgi:predicted nucleic acid-binding protein